MARQNSVTEWLSTRPDEVWPPLVREVCQLATAHYGVRKVRAATSLQNAASQKVLTKAGFLPVGPADPADLGGKPGTWYERVLADE